LLTLFLSSMPIGSPTKYTFAKRDKFCIVYQLMDKELVLIDTIISKAEAIDGFSCGLIGDKLYTLELSPATTSGGARVELNIFMIKNKKVFFVKKYSIGNVLLYDIKVDFKGCELVFSKEDKMTLELKQKYIMINEENLLNLKNLFEKNINELVSKKNRGNRF